MSDFSQHSLKQLNITTVFTASCNIPLYLDVHHFFTHFEHSVMLINIQKLRM